MKKQGLIIGLLIFMLVMGNTMIKNNTTIGDKKIIPEGIKREAKVALSHYPALKNTNIEFVIKPSLKQSFMKAQPVFSSLLGSKKNRAYKILISDSFALENKRLDLKEIPENVLIGWIGHELGHIMDYKNRSSFDLICFGVRYYFSDNYIKKAERIADSYAVSHNMDHYVIATKNFILNHTDLSDKYKNRIKRLYVSPNEILKIVEEQKKSID